MGIFSLGANPLAI